nr:unnamed protein product [Callosobruchus chinensis]
MVCDWHCKTH